MAHEKPIQRITKEFHEVNASLLGEFISKGNAGKHKNVGTHIYYYSINGTVVLLVDYRDERGSYQIYKVATDSTKINDDIEFIRSL